MLIALIWLLSIATWLWLVVRVFSTSGVVAGLFTVFIWPSAIVSVVRQWNDPENSVARPFFATLIASVALYTFALRGVNELLAEHEARLAKGSGMTVADLVDDDDPISESIRLRAALEAMASQRGEVSIPPAHATLAIPAHFRLIPRSAIDRVATEVSGGMLEPTIVGWLVHDSVSNTDLVEDEDAWLIEVSYAPIGHVSASDDADLAGAALAEENRRLMAEYGGGDFSFVSFAHTPAWRADIGALTWGERLSYVDEPDPLIDCYASKPTREGVIEFFVEYMPERRSELCLRSVRLMAASTRFDPDWSWDDYSFFTDRRAGADFEDLVTGAAFE